MARQLDYGNMSAGISPRAGSHSPAREDGRNDAPLKGSALTNLPLLEMLSERTRCYVRWAGGRITDRFLFQDAQDSLSRSRAPLDEWAAIESLSDDLLQRGLLEIHS